MAELPGHPDQFGRRGPLPHKDHPTISRRGFLKLGAAAAATGAALIASQNLDHIGSIISTEAEKAAISINTNKGSYELNSPTGRTGENLSAIPTRIETKDIPSIPNDEPNLPSGATLGFDGTLNSYGIVGQGPDGVVGTLKYYPQANITGYLIGKERQPDGSILFAVELPNIASPKDIMPKDNQTSTPQEEKSPRGSTPKTDKLKIGGAIVWIKTYNSPNPTYEPFMTTITEGPDSFYGNGIGNATNISTGQDQFAKYSRIGDLVSAHVQLEINPDDLDHIDKSLNNFVSRYHYGDSPDVLKTKLQQDVNNNMSTAKQLSSDAGKNVPISEQLSGKKYVFTADKFSFIAK